MKKKILLGVLVATLFLGVSAGIASATSTNMRNATGPSSGHLWWRTVYPKETSLTIYNDVTLVKEVYEIDLPENEEKEIWFGNFPDQVDPSSIRIKSLTQSNRLSVLEQSFNKIYYKRTLVCRVLSVSDYKRHEIELSYFVSGITWQAKYRLEEESKSSVDRNEEIFKFNSWVVITNQAGKPIELEEYKNAKIKLVAGDVHRASGRFYTLGEGKAPSDQFEERKFFEYHTYTLNKPTTLKYDGTKVIPLFETFITADEFISSWFDTTGEAEKKLIFEGQRSNKVQIWLSFLNSEDNGLGMPLPAGVIQVFKKDSDGQLEFIGEDQIDHTPKDEKISLYIGNAFDIVGERTVTDRKQIDARTWEETIEITLKNHKDEDVKVCVIERFYGDWEFERILIRPIRYAISAPMRKDANATESRVIVPKNGETVIIYTVRYKR